MLDMDDIEGQFSSTVTSLKSSEIGKITLYIAFTNMFADCGFKMHLSIRTE